MGSRKYGRDKRGRFASGGNVSKTTTGKAGGFANAKHREKVQRKVKRKARNRKIAVRGAGIAAVGLYAASSRRRKR